jgi:hypothetical protein
MQHYPPFNTRLGTQIIGPRYCFTPDGALLEAARGMLELRSQIIKFTLADEYLGSPRTPELKRLAELAAQHAHFRAVLDMPFRYFVLWVHPLSRGMSGELSWSSDEEADIYCEMRDLATHLLKTYSGSGKVFLLGQWEADWVLLGAFEPERDVTPERAAGMVRYLEIRQRAVEDARHSVSHHDVWVAHYAEVNRPLDAKDRGLRRMSNAVLPRVALDMVSYSAYDALWPNRIAEALDYVESQACFTSYFDDVFEKRVFIGEYDAYRDYHRNGYFTPEQQVENTLEVITSGLSWGAPFILFWEYYNNEHERLVHGGGFWLIDDQGRKQPVYDLHRELLANIGNLVNLYRARLGRNPTERELNAAAGSLRGAYFDALLSRLFG